MYKDFKQNMECPLYQQPNSLKTSIDLTNEPFLENKRIYVFQLIKSRKLSIIIYISESLRKMGTHIADYGTETTPLSFTNAY